MVDNLIGSKRRDQGVRRRKDGFVTTSCDQQERDIRSTDRMPADERIGFVNLRIDNDRLGSR